MTWPPFPREACFPPCSAIHLSCNRGFQFHEMGSQVASSQSVQSFKLTVRQQAQRSWLATQGISPRRNCGAFWSYQVTSCPTPAASCSSCPNLFLLWHIFLQESKQMAVGAAGAPGQNVEPVPRKGGDSATTLHPRMEVPHAQGRAHRPGPAEYLWMQPGKTVNCCSKGMQANKDHLLHTLIHYFSRMNLMIRSLYQLTGSKTASLFQGGHYPILLRATFLSY